MAKRPPSSRPSRSNPSEDEEKYRTPLRPRDPGLQLALSSSTQTNLAVAKNIASSNDYPVGGSKAGDRGRSLLGLLRDEMGDEANTFLDQQLTLLARKYADRGEKLSQTSPESIQAVHAAVLGAVFSRWLELNPESKTARAIERMLNRQKDKDVYANAIATLINQFVSTGALRPSESATDTCGRCSGAQNAKRRWMSGMGGLNTAVRCASADA